MSNTETTAGIAVRPHVAAGVAMGWPWREGNRFHLLTESDRIFRRTLEVIAGARESVLLEMYLVESGAASPARSHDGKMLRSGVRIFEYQPRVLHGKMALCDDWLSIGSSHFDRWSFRWNLEANQEIESASLAAQAGATFAADCGGC